MIAFDTSVLVEILLGNPRMIERAAKVPANEQTVPVVVVEEIIRGRLNTIRQAEAGRSRIGIARAYELFQQSLGDLRHLSVLPYTPEADLLFQQWREQKIRVGTHDLRIAASCISRKIVLVSLNRRDFDRVPGLLVEYWD